MAGRPRLEIVGGPLDGLSAPCDGGPIRFLDANGDLHVEPGPGRHIYWISTDDDGRTAYWGWPPDRTKRV